jgi:hypothetical protein
MAESTRKILLVIVLVFLLLPKLQQIFPVIESAPLSGIFHTSPNIGFSIDQWIDGSYQETKSKYLNDNISFRPDLIRLNCQVDYSLFYKLNTGWAVLGKNNCLFDITYINAWSGADFLGYNTICSRMVKLRALQDTFARLGKSLILVHAASKAYYYSDCIPDQLVPPEKRPTNFATCLRIGDSLGIKQLDFNTWFCAMRSTSRELLYPKQGLHWSYYGGMLAADSLVHYIEKLRKINMPHPRWANPIHSSEPKSPDNDLVATLNLIWPFTTETFTYGTTICDSDKTKTKPSAIYIGDSFTWALVDNNVFDCINSNWEFWYYFRERFKRGGAPREALPMEHYDWQAAIDRTDYIVLLYSAPILDRLGSGFIEKEYEHYFPGRQ